MKNPGFAKRILVLGCLLVCQHAAIAADETLTKAKQQLDSQQAKEAYALLAPLQSQRAGDTEYDYLLVEKVSLPPLEAPQAIIERETTGSTVIFNEQVNEYGHADVFDSSSSSCSNCSSGP